MLYLYPKNGTLFEQIILKGEAYGRNGRCA